MIKETEQQLVNIVIAKQNLPNNLEILRTPGNSKNINSQVSNYQHP